MSTDSYNILNIILQFLVWVAMIATFMVYYKQLKTMRTSATGQNILSLVNFLQAPHVRDSRTIVREILNSKPYGSWTAEEKRAASLVCSTYDAAAILIFQQRLVPSEPFVTNWGGSIKACYEILEPHMIEMRKPELSGEEYWDNFRQLYEGVCTQRSNKRLLGHD